MNQTTLLLDTKELIKEFIFASENIDLLRLEELLDENGAYEIEDETFEINETSKSEFLKWYTSKLKTTKITNIIYDQCIGCSFGKNIVILNNGTFPRMPQEFSENTKSGIMLDSKEGRINKIQFCFSFLKTENKAVYECVGEELVKYIKQGFSEEEAVAMYDANPNSEYSYITKKINQKEINELPF